MGCQIEVPTLEGKARITLEPGVQSGKVLRLKAKGLPSIDRYGKGDLLITLNVWTPESLTKEEKRIMEELSQSLSFTPETLKRTKEFFSRMREYFQ